MNKSIPPKPQFIKCITIYEGIGLLQITEDFKPKGIIERFDYWCYKILKFNQL